MPPARNTKMILYDSTLGPTTNTWGTRTFTSPPSRFTMAFLVFEASIPHNLVSGTFQRFETVTGWISLEAWAVTGGSTVTTTSAVGIPGQTYFSFGTKDVTLHFASDREDSSRFYHASTPHEGSASRLRVWGVA